MSDNRRRMTNLNRDCCANDRRFDTRFCSAGKKLVGGDRCNTNQHSTSMAPHRDRRMCAETGAAADVCSIKVSKMKRMLFSWRRRDRCAAAVMPLNPESQHEQTS
jgi:hypothetical protein